MIEFEAPGMTAADPVGRLKEVENYLWYLKERLEFVLNDIGMENFSVDFRRKLAAMGADISGARDMAGIGEQRAANAEEKSLTVADGGEGYLRVCDGTQILYGVGQAGDVVFARGFAEPPAVFTMPQGTVQANTDGFVVDGAEAFCWMAIGRGKEGMGNGT